jgi:hypothetical protein
METTNTNGRQRKSLASQIDRLDEMLDGLADSLNDAVADAVKGAVALAVQEAVRAALTEVLSNPAVLAKLQPAQPAPAAEPAVAAPTLGEQFASCGNWLAAKAKSASSCLRSGLGRVCALGSTLIGHATHGAGVVLEATAVKVREVSQRCRLLWHIRYQIALALGVGLVLGIGGYHAGPFLAAAASGVCGFVVTLAVQAALWVRRLFPAAPPRRVAGEFVCEV